MDLVSYLSLMKKNKESSSFKFERIVSQQLCADIIHKEINKICKNPRDKINNFPKIIKYVSILHFMSLYVN